MANELWKKELPKGVYEYIDDIDEKWNTFKFDAKNPTPTAVNGYILHSIVFYTAKKYKDNALWESFREDFEEWTIETWKLANGHLVRDLRNHLRRYGVKVKKDGGKIKERLQEVINNPEEPTWSQEEIDYQLKNEPKTDIYSDIYGSFLSDKYVQQDSQYAPQTPLQTTPVPTPAQLPAQQYGQQTNYQPAVPMRTYTPTPDAIPTKEITNLMKIYINQDDKYGGEMYDILDAKLQVFYDYCNKAGIQAHQYHHAFSAMLKGRASVLYYSQIQGRMLDFNTMVQRIRDHFENDETYQLYLSEWRETTFQRVIDENTTKTRAECLQLLFDKLQMIQLALPDQQGGTALRNQVISACRGVPECTLALFQPGKTYEAVCAQLRSAVGTAMRNREDQRQFTTNYEHHDYHDQSDETYWTDRTYRGQGNYRNRGYTRGNSNRGSSRGRSGSRGGLGSSETRETREKRCYICSKPNCWSTKHSIEERKHAYERFKSRSQHPNPSHTVYQNFVVQIEGIEGLTDNTNDETRHENEQLFADEEDSEKWLEFDTFITELGDINGRETVEILANQAVFHAVTKTDVFKSTDKQTGNLPGEYSAFTLDRYSSEIFQGIMPDSGAAGVSTAGEPQFQALRKLFPSIKLDTATAGQHKIKFGKGEAISQGTATVNTPIGPITFHIVPANTPFLFCIQDMDKLGVKLDNLENVLIQGDNIVPIVRKWGHPWMLLQRQEEAIAWSHLTETELRQLHRRFGHPSVRRLVDILHRAGYHDVQQRAIEHLTKYCHYCQLYGKAPSRFRFTLKDDYDFNHCVIVDVMYLDSKPVLHVIDEATAFQAARFLRDMTAKTTWETLRVCWIDVYQGPPDIIVSDAGKNFASEEFRQHASSLDIDIKEVPVEAHNSIGKVERYHGPLRRAYEILTNELPSTNKDALLQMAVKAINDSAGPDGIVPTLLVFGAYPRLTKDSPPSPSVTERAEAIYKAMKEVRRIYAERQVKEALAMRNGPNTYKLHELPLQSNVLVYREKNGWNGPYKLIAINGETCTIQMPYGPTDFRSTVVKPYYTDESSSHDITITAETRTGNGENEGDEDTITVEPDTANKENNEENDDTEQATEPVKKRGRGRPRKHAVLTSATYITAKEQADYELSIKLRQQGIITTSGKPFELSDRKEIDALVARGVFAFEQFDEQKHVGRIFKSRIVREIKGKQTNTPYEKSRLVIQAYNDAGKELILTQSPTIQRASQRLLIAIAPTLLEKEQGISLWLRDITQAYVQSTTFLQRQILAHLPVEIEDLYPKNTIMVVLKPLYGVPEAGMHWWATYSKHHKEKLSMEPSTYDPCLLISTNKERFGIVAMQTDDTLGLSNDRFAILEDEELRKAQFTAKPKETLSTAKPLQFNGCTLSLANDTIKLTQKGQGTKIELVDLKSADRKQIYVQQRARGAYIASICQPEAAFDLSVAAQHQEPTTEEYLALNKRLEWQTKNLDRGLKYVILDLNKAKIYVFVDGSFANNKDLSSQIGFIIILANENENTGSDEFNLYGNLIHWSSTKSKRVTRSVLASEIYGMVAGADLAYVIGSTLAKITSQLDLPTAPIVVCTDSFSLYECLVKLGTTKEKRLMVDIMALRQSYERRELYEIRWINGLDNPADAMTKAIPNKALETFVSTNQMRVRIEGWVKRE